MTNIDIIKIVIVILELIFLTLGIIFYKENKYIKASYMGLLALICYIIINCYRSGDIMKENNYFKQEVAKFINKEVMGSEFVDKDLDKYIYASLSQPPIKILNKNGSNDEMNFTVECPNCHRAVCYGDSIYMLNGYIYCNMKGCREKLMAIIGDNK